GYGVDDPSDDDDRADSHSNDDDNHDIEPDRCAADQERHTWCPQLQGASGNHPSHDLHGRLDEDDPAVSELHECAEDQADADLRAQRFAVTVRRGSPDTAGARRRAAESEEPMARAARSGEEV